MTIKFIHTSDWQIGKVFRFLDDTRMGLLQEARLRAVIKLGELANTHGATHILVAGDVYDMEVLSSRSLNQPLERMRGFPGIQWHLLLGNHDPHRPNGIWDQLLRKGLPDNVKAHIRPEPVILQEEAVALLPAPLFHRRTLDDPTAYMDSVDCPEDYIRIGLAHGTIRGFGSGDEDVSNLISPDRPARAGLSYLALGDWHGQKKINDRCWYSGTHEIDAFDIVNGGQALLVQVDGAQATPTVTPIATGNYTWTKLSERINSREDIDHLAEKLRNCSDDLDRALVHLSVEGAVSLENRRYFQDQIVDGTSAALCFIRIDDHRLFPKPTAEDLDQIDRGGFVRAAAEELKRLSEEGEGNSGIAAAALQRLYLEHMKLQGEQR